MILSSKTLGLGLAFIAVVVFGSTLPVTRLVLVHFDPWFITAVRALSAALAALAVLVAMRRRLPDPRHWPTLVVISLCLVLGFPAFTAVAMETVPAAHGGVVLGILPLATAVAATLINGERPSGLFWLFAALGSGLVLVFTLSGENTAYHAGDLLLLGATASAAIGYTLSGRLSHHMPGWEVISWALIVALPLAVFATWSLWPPEAATAPASGWLLVGFLGLMPQYLAFFGWNAGMVMSGVARVSQVQLLQTFVTIGFAALLVGERIDMATLLFATAVVATVALGSRTRVVRASQDRVPPERKTG